jgi:hypothetical protein
MDLTRAAWGVSAVLLVGSLWGGTCVAAEKSTFSVKVTKAISVTPKESGGVTAKVHAEITLKNDDDKAISASPRQLIYELREKQADGKLGEPHRFFGITEPDRIDAQPLDPGKTVKLEADLESHTIGVDVGSKHILTVTNPNNDNASQQAEVTFK